MKACFSGPAAPFLLWKNETIRDGHVEPLEVHERVPVPVVCLLLLWDNEQSL
jgi:hypothetical protein